MSSLKQCHTIPGVMTPALTGRVLAAGLIVLLLFAKTPFLGLSPLLLIALQPQLPTHLLGLVQVAENGHTLSTPY